LTPARKESERCGRSAPVALSGRAVPGGVAAPGRRIRAAARDGRPRLGARGGGGSRAHRRSACARRTGPRRTTPNHPLPARYVRREGV